MILEKSETEKIEQTIKEVEKTTSGEVVPMILKESDFYGVAHLRLSLIMNFLSAIILFVFFPYEFDSTFYLFLITLFSTLGYVLCFIPFIKRMMLFNDEITEEVNQRAFQAFFENNLHTSRDRTGVLVFVTLLERRVIVLADSGINEKVEEGTWDKVKDEFVEFLKRKEITSGFVHTLKNIGEILTKHFPIKDDDTNELSNKLVQE